MKNKQLLSRLRKINACSEAVDWVDGMDFKKAWETCERADWMLWYMCKTEMGTKRERIHIVCDCAATALKHVPKGEDRPRKAIEAARRYADNPTDENAAARAVAWAAAWDAAWDGARDAAEAAAEAAARAAAWAAAEDAAHKKMCNMIREKIKGE